MIRGRPDNQVDIPNHPFGTQEPISPEVVVQTVNGNLTIPGAIVDDNSLKVVAAQFLVGGFDFGTF